MTVGPGAILGHVRSLRSEFVDFVSALARVESPSDVPASQAGVHALLRPALEELEYEVRTVVGHTSGDHLLARPRERDRRRGRQLLIGHTDTVWPIGTLAQMPVCLTDGRLHGPGTLDMKGGLTQIVFALRALRDLGLEPPLTPIVFVNADEEVGSPDSRKWVRRLAKAATRAFVAEPSMGPDGLIKTARKGVGRFEITIRGRAAHAGLEPEAGASAILELAYVVQRLHALNDPEHGTTVNVGVVSGGTRPNVVAPLARASVDARVTSLEQGRRLEDAVAAIRPTVPGVRIEIDGGIQVAPLERTPRNRRLWEQARAVGADLGLDLEQTIVGGGSDGNTTSLYTATLDGLGCVGDGPHAVHEHIVVDRSLERCALLACLLLAPPDGRTES